MKILFSILLLLTGLSAAFASESSNTEHQPITGLYKIYGGGLGDETPPGARDKKVMFSITGAAARDVFEQIGPDKKDNCKAGQGIRVRQRDGGNLFCLRSKEGNYKCNIGFDLITGKSIGGIIC